MRSSSRSEPPLSARGDRSGRGAAVRSFVVLVAALLVAAPALGAIHFAQGFVTGRYFDPATSDWGRRMISLYRDDQGMVTVRGGNGRERVQVGLTADEADRLRRTLSTALGRLDGRAGDTGPDVVDELLRIVHGRGTEVHGLALTYLGTGPEEGAPALLLFLQDRDRPIARMELYLGSEEAARLAGLIGDLLSWRAD